MLSLVGHSRGCMLDQPRPRAPAHVQRLLESLTASPAYAIESGWGISAWNAACAALHPNTASAAVEDSNLRWLDSTDPCVRELLPAPGPRRPESRLRRTSSRDRSGRMRP